ncbi:lef-3 [Clostera anastomosis granulovirus A]|uniref:Lef-3 n=1 Tax=Clostera anastomosis granulovirus A TaxID=1986289 RepID=U5KAW1_9BBAC|nr:lef-3 [Clostera anastomosis granulovirus Henan]AGQ20357.1 lef-3 [Clostera anastomosis granulovirus Henan]
MSKRPSETPILDVDITDKKMIVTTDQIVLMKRKFQKGTDQVDSNVVFKLDCRTVNSNEQNLVYVDSEEMFDNIIVNCSYTFIVEKKGRRWHLLNMTQLENEKLIMKKLEMSDFTNKTDTLVNFYIIAAYQKSSGINMFGLIELENEYKQCDMFVNFSGPGCFNFTEDESNIQKSNRALTKIYNELVNKWWVFGVTCSINANKTINMTVKDNSQIDASENEELICGKKPNLSYIHKNYFYVCQVFSVGKCEFISGTHARLKFTFTVENEEIMYATKFIGNEETAQEVISDVNSVNFDIKLGSVIKCVYMHRLYENTHYYNVVSILCIDSDKNVTTIL